ncbi:MULTISPECIES: PDR/VanB family oxidoreductase [unclassified Acinetobacter]|uniref:PDR/VanB family oxidoreductase n=1 Tax=unclassified Acinetobacter TaxID=196816 RepID=UPI00293428EB|nr:MULTISPECIES: PDR/VanB family oxidoreductase [unclassified Acinetobacter]WOE32571.1 PDR/VanB family oxidoreductase [Acinetobacter sp. SAAs470]WOE38046.1 PDR/VanB family oxidoreductase [Acinetobacter sp. SAAs474]
MESLSIELVVTDIQAEAKDIILLELQHPQRQSLPAFTAGSHIEVYLVNGLIRHYSLLNSPTETHRYVIAVALAPQGRGGSQSIHHDLSVGDLVHVSHPRNHFRLHDADQYCFIAGGIGITPILSMIQHCITYQKKWRLFYTVRHKQRAAFYEQLQQWQNANIHFHFNDEHHGQHLEITNIVDSLSATEQIYCCGPTALMQSVQDASAHLSSHRVHFEWFNPVVSLTTDHDIQQESFTVQLKNSGQNIQVLADQSILEALEQHGFELPFSCRAGICRTCETTVCSGIPEHRDMILTEEEKAANTSMLICVSRAKSAVIELNL